MLHTILQHTCSASRSNKSALLLPSIAPASNLGKCHQTPNVVPVHVPLGIKQSHLITTTILCGILASEITSVNVLYLTYPFKFGSVNHVINTLLAVQEAVSVAQTESINQQLRLSAAEIEALQHQIAMDRLATFAQEVQNKFGPVPKDIMERVRADIANAEVLN